jgi:hypothetical protein
MNAPWTLHGDGYMLFYKFSREFAEQHGFVPPELAGRFDGGFGAVMLVNYQESPVGPYRELLFIPGKFRTPQGRRYSITRIFVDSEASTQHGRANWGIPKYTRTFQVEQDGNTEHIRVLNEQGQPGFDIRLRAGGLRFPVTTALIPLHLYQIWEGRTFLTTPKGSGSGQLARVPDLYVDPAFFPDVRLAKPFLAIKVSGFRMEFPPAQKM